jgi:hypothetical protein
VKLFHCAVLCIAAFSGFCTAAMAVSPPPLDRPTPPPCCADGFCYPRPTTFGWYERRWRRWPTEELQPTPAGVRPPDRLAPEIPAFDLPPPEEEDRSAPRPTQPPDEEGEEEREGAPAAETPSATPLVPRSDSGLAPPERMLPFEDDPPGTEPTPRPFGEPMTPPTTPLPFGEPGLPGPAGQPTGDLDPPPALPFGTPSRNVSKVAERRAGNSVSRPMQPETRGRTAPSPQRPSNDPPPSLPISLAQATY